MPTRDPVALKKALQVKEKVAEGLMKDPNITGVGAGFRTMRGRRTDQICIRVYVRKKLPKTQLRSDEILPRTIDGIPVDVVEGFFEVHHGGNHPTPAEHQQRHDPLRGGISVGNLRLGGAGTLGVWAVDNDNSDLVFLSNWHVLCGRVDCTAGEPVVQPGKVDGGDEEDTVGELHRVALTRQVDGALARLTGARALLQSNLGLGAVADVAEPLLGMRVRKSGRTTGVTAAVITDPSATVKVCGYPVGDEFVLPPLCGPHSTFRRTFVNQIVIEGENSSQRGDSGSVWIDDANWLVGLNFAGSGQTLALANPMLAVLDALRISIGLSILDLIAVGNILH